MGRVLAATANIFLSVLLGAVLLAVVAVEFPNAMQSLQHGASWITDRITGTGLDPKYNVWVTFLVDDRQIVFIGFIIVMRIFLAVVMSGVGRTLGFGYR